MLRVARFAARYAHLGFRIADETMALMQAMTAAGELEHLIPERVWKETESALGTRNPQVYFQTLRDCGALKVLFPEIDALFGVPAPAKWHPEIDTGVHVLMTLSMAAMLTPAVDVRFATLCHDLGKGLTPKALWPATTATARRASSWWKTSAPGCAYPMRCAIWRSWWRSTTT